jgi:hypothetical protein
MRCDINRINNKAKEIQKANPSMSDKDAREAAINFLIEIREDEKTEYTETEGKRLQELWGKVTGGLTSTGLDVISEVGNLKGALQKILNPSELDELAVFMLEAGVNIDEVINIEHENIKIIKNLIAIHEKNGNDDQVTKLRFALTKEEEALKKREENRKRDEKSSVELTTKIEILELIQSLTELVADSTVDEKVKTLRNTYVKLANQLKLDRARVTKANDELTALEEQRKKATTKAEKTKIDAFIVEHKKKNKDLVKLSKGFDTRIETLQKLEQEINKLTGDTELAKFIDSLTREVQTLKTSLITKGAQSLTINYSAAARTAKQMVIQREKLATIAESGRQARIEYLKNYALSTGEIPVEMVREAFGKYAVEASQKKNPDKNTVDIEDISNIWKSQVISTYRGGFFTADVGQLSSEAINKLNNFILGKELTDPTTPEAMDPTFGPTLEIEEAMAHPDAQKGVIPESNKVNTHEELVRIVDSALRRLRTVYGFSYFNGVIPEKVLLQILDPKMMDIGPKAWEKARTRISVPRKISTISTIDRGSLGKNLLRSTGVDPDKLLEYTDFEFNSKFDKLITLDIEARGDIEANDDSRVEQVYTMQLCTREVDAVGNINLKIEILVNVDGKLVNILDVSPDESKARKPLTKDQISSVIDKLDQAQNEGFKVGTYNGNNYDLAYLQQHVNDVDTLTRVGLRSFDLLAHITSAIPAANWQSKVSTKGKRLKEIVITNTTGDKKVFNRTAPPPFGGGRFIFDGGSVKDKEDDNKPIELEAGKGIEPMWLEATSSGDWSRFDAYSINDVYLTMDLFVGLSQKETSTLRINESTVAEVRQPMSNLNLNVTGDVFESSPIESMGELGRRNEKINDILETAFYETEVGYDADKIFDILAEWLMAGLAASPNKASQDRFKRIKAAIEAQVGKETSYEAALAQKAQEFQQGIKAQLQNKFETFGFVLSLNYSNSGLNPDVVSIVSNREGFAKGTYNESNMYNVDSTDKKDPEIYITHVLNSFINFIRKPENKFKFADRLKERVNPREINPGETEHEYWKDVLESFLYSHLDDFTSLSNFGDGTLDWKPANEVGQAIAQVIMDTKPGVRVVDVLVHQGESMESIQIKTANENMVQGKHRPKVYGMPNRNNVNMSQPHPLVDELIAYEGYKLRQRLKWAHTVKITPEIEKFLTERRRQGPGDQLSMYLKETVLDISPDVAAREVIASIPNLDERRLQTAEAMFDIPRLLMSINHDCQYIGMNAPKRFLTRGKAGERPLFYAEDFINPGAATAAVTFAGGIQQLAFMTNFGFMSPETEKALLEAFDRGIQQIRQSIKNGINPWDSSNKADWKYMGKHTIMAQLVAYRSGGSSEIFVEVLQALGVKDKDGNPIIDPIGQKIVIGERELEDPRFKLFNLLIGNDAAPGYLFQLLDPNSPIGQKFDPTNSDIPSHVNNIILKLNSAYSGNRDSIKDFLKGAITPAYYMAGYPGIRTGLEGKNDELPKASRLSEEEIKILASFITHSKIISEGRIIDEAIGYSRENVEALKQLLMDRARQRLTPANAPNPKEQPYLLEKATREENITSLQEYLDTVLGFISDRVIPLGKSRDEFIEETKKRYEARISEAADYWSKLDFDKMKTNNEYYNDHIFEMNKLLSGGEEAAKRNLMVYGLARRATTGYQVQEDVAEIHSTILGIPLTPEDYLGVLNNDVYFRYGIEPASGRNHMVRWWGIGPEGPKYAQPKVVEGKEINQRGMWDIADREKTTEDFNELFNKQILLDLVKFYRPPAELGYDPENESVSNFFQEVEKRSATEIEAYEEAKFMESGRFPDSKKITFSNGYSITIGELREFRSKAAGNAANRLRFRTTVRDDITDATDVAVLDTKMPGFGALRPFYANFDFTQRGIYSLIRVQNGLNISMNKGLGLLELAQQRADAAGSDPNNVIPTEDRGFVYRYSKDQMPMIPQSSEDVDGLLALGAGRDARKLKLAGTLENTLVAFGVAHGLDSLVKSKNWGKLFLIKKIHDRAFLPSVRTLRTIKSTDKNTGEDDRKVKTAVIKYHDGLSRTLGITASSLGGKQRYSTIDLMISEDTNKVTLEDIDKLRARYPDRVMYGNLLNYLSHSGQIERLMGLKYGITIYPGNVVRGIAGRTNLPGTTGLPVVNFGQEILVMYADILGSEIGRKLITPIVNKWISHGKVIPGLIRDKAGFIIPESIDPVNEPEVWREIMHKINVEMTQAMAEINANFEFAYNEEGRVLLRDKEGRVIKEPDTLDNPLTYQGISSGQPFVYTQVDNPITLHQFTIPMLNQLLNAIENYDFFRNYELALATDKEINVFQSSVDPLVREEQARLFEQVRDNTDVESEALLLLQDTNPPENVNDQLEVLTDPRSKDFAGNPKRVVNFGSYYKSTNTIPIVLGGKIRAVPTADAVYFTKVMAVAQKARKLNLTRTGKKNGVEVTENIADVLEKFLLDAIAEEPKRPAHMQSYLEVKMLALSFEVHGNAFAVAKLPKYLNLKNPKQISALRKQVDPMVDLMVQTMHATPAEQDPLLYKALAILERDRGYEVSRDTIDRRFREELFSDSGLNPTDKASGTRITSVINQARMITQTIPQVEEADIPEAANGGNPTVFTDRENFINSFTNPNHKIAAENIVNMLDKMVADGIISPWLRDMKLMVIGTVGVNQPDIFDNLSLEILDGTNTLMNAMRKDGRFTIGLNFKALKVTSENQVLFKFAEEILHIARLKYIETDSVEWKKIKGVFESSRSTDMIRDVLMSMNNGKSYATIEKEVAYAKSNPDEFFAHMGAFLLLRQVLGAEQAIIALNTKYAEAEDAFNLWKRAFYRIRSLTKRILTTFNAIRFNPQYSGLMEPVEQVVMSVIGTGAEKRTGPVANPDAVLNTYSQQATTHDNKRTDPATKLKIKKLLDRANDPLTTADTRQQLQDQASKLDSLTMFGLSELQVERTLNNLGGTLTKDNRVISPKDIEDEETSKAILSRLFSNAIEQKGMRADDIRTMGGVVRKFMPESWISTGLQQYLVGTFNGLELTWNSPFAPSAGMAFLIDNHAATTRGSFAPTVSGLSPNTSKPDENRLYAGGLDQQKLMVDPYVQNVNNIWGECSNAFPHRPDIHLNIVRDVVQRLNNVGKPGPSKLADARQIQFSDALTDAWFVFGSRARDIMVDSQFAEDADSLDRFPIRLKDYSLVGPTEMTKGFESIRELVKNKKLNILKRDGIKAPISAVGLHAAGSLPLELSADDERVIRNIQNHVITNGGFGGTYNFVPDTTIPVSENRQHMLYALFAQASIKHQQKLQRDTGRPQPQTALANVDNNVGTVKPITTLINNEIKMLGYALRNHTTSLDDALDLVTQTEVKQLIVNDYIKAIQENRSISEDKAGLQATSLYQEVLGYYPKATEYRKQSLVGKSINDILAEQFTGELGKNSVMGKLKSWMPTSNDIYTSNDVIIQQIFETGVDTITKSFLRGTVYDAIERIIVNRTIGVDGVYLSFAQVLKMLEEANKPGTGAGIHQISLLDTNGTKVMAENQTKWMKASISRLRQAVDEARGTNTVNDLEMGAAMQWLNSAAKNAVVLRWGSNINVATFLVEGTTTLWNTVSPTNPIRTILDLFYLGRDFSIQAIPSWALETVYAWVPSVRFENSKPDIKVVPLRRHTRRDMARNSVFFLEESTSPLLPHNFNNADYSSALVEKMGWGSRFMETLRRSNSNVMRSLRVANEAQANRHIVRLLGNKGLSRLRDELRKNPTSPQSVADVRELFKKSGVSMTQEEAVYLVRSGILEGRCVEVLDWVRTHRMVFRGCVMFQDLFKIEQDLLTNPSASYPFNINDLRQTVASLSRFMGDYTQMAMVTRKSMDAPSVNNLAAELITFYKSYPSLFMAQQLLRRGSIASPVKFGVHLMLNIIMDALYGTILALARGAWELDEVLEKAKKNQINWSETVKLLLRHPTFQNNILGFVSNYSYRAVEGGLGGGLYSSVQESALGSTLMDSIKFFKDMSEPEATWTDATMQLYLKFGPILPADLGAAHFRILAQLAHDPGTFGRTSRSNKKTAIGEAMKYYNSASTEGQWKQWVRDVTPGYRPNVNSMKFQNEKALLNDYVRTKANNLPEPKPRKKETTEPPQVQLPQVQQPQVQPPTSKPSLSKEATSFEKAPEGL